MTHKMEEQQAKAETEQREEKTSKEGRKKEKRIGRNRKS